MGREGPQVGTAEVWCSVISLSAPLTGAGPGHSAWHSSLTFKGSHPGFGTPGYPALSARGSVGRAPELSLASSLPCQPSSHL